jgi:hypothetical protein
VSPPRPAREAVIAHVLVRHGGMVHVRHARQDDVARQGVEGEARDLVKGKVRRAEERAPNAMRRSGKEWPADMCVGAGLRGWVDGWSTVVWRRTLAPSASFPFFWRGSCPWSRISENGL